MARALPDELDLELALDEPDDEAALRGRAAKKLRVGIEAVPHVVIRKRSIDARKGRVRFHVLLGLAPEEAPRALGEPLPREVSGPLCAIVVGDGPAGLFCAYELARQGLRAVVLDRGKPVQPRRHDLKGLQRKGTVSPESNYCFGEGGAGTYSDGKLYTRAHKRGDVRDVIETLALHGAPAAILVDARPHIGSNKLPKVITGMRERLEACGVELRFESRVVGLRVEGAGSDRRVRGVSLASGEILEADHVVMATGHSARDVFGILLDAGVRLEPKAFALGVRIEHPQPLIDRLQYGRDHGHPKLPAASYRLAREVEGRGVFTFCMCPGGWIVPASTEVDGLVVNGMSLSRRDSPFANSGLVVSVEPEDWARAGFSGPLGGVALQRAIEVRAMQAGGGELGAPATRVTDFLRGRGSSTVPASSYLPGLVGGDVAEVLDGAGVPFAARLREALRAFDRRMHGYATEEAVLVATESRTSAPVRVPRDPQTLEARDLRGLYPAGEGAGYAGGIVSAAMDGVRIGRAIGRAIRERA
ncbi:MAG: FAD-binding protein [Sandaracinaceae bacterium]|nr:FAD-binding protein [Sandaracinaceae bacterium]